MATEQFPAWARILEKMVRSLPSSAAELPELRAVGEQVARYLSHGEGQPDVIEQRVRAVATRHVDLLLASAEQVVNEIFRLIDPEIERLKATKGALNEQDKADGKGYVNLLEECNRILEEMKRDQRCAPARVH